MHDTRIPQKIKESERMLVGLNDVGVGNTWRDNSILRAHDVAIVGRAVSNENAKFVVINGEGC
jgi:hypothetical protein